MLPDERPSQETLLADRDEFQDRKERLGEHRCHGAEIGLARYATEGTLAHDGGSKRRVADL